MEENVRWRQRPWPVGRRGREPGRVGNTSVKIAFSWIYHVPPSCTL